MVSPPADTLVSLGGQRVARAAATVSKSERVRIPASEAEAWKDLVEALTDYGPRRDAVKASR